MSIESTYRVNAPHVISEIIDGEAIILNFESGSYYSLNESGMLIWACIQSGQTSGDMLEAVRRRYVGADKEAKIDLSGLLETLKLEQLIVAADASIASGPDDYSGPVTDYIKPGLEKFSDLEELLLLDPIHDVDESGWPQNAP